MARAYIQLYYSYTEQLQLLPPEQCGKLTIALLNYAQTGVIPDFPADSAVFMLFSSIRSQIDRDYTRYEAKCKKNSDNANQRWHGNEANASDNMRTDANYAKEKENDLQYCSLASTYLRERRWLDEPPVQASNDVAAPFFSLELDANGNEVAIDD